MPNLTPTLENVPIKTAGTAVVGSPIPPYSAPTLSEAEGSAGIGQVFELLMIPVIAVGYHVAVTVLKLIGSRHR